MRQKLNLITLGVRDLERAVTFYENGLGWKRSPGSAGDMLLFPLGGMILGLYPRHALAEDIGIKDEESGFSGITISYNAKSEKEVDEVLTKAKKAGASIIKEAQKVFWGGYSGYFRDPEGHLFEVAHNPFWEFDENDNIKLP
jgi:catechol 2,3-dioxygenase-like lactoylglutathione lyase family enzyme